MANFPTRQLATIRHEIPQSAFFRFAPKSFHRNDSVLCGADGKNEKTATAFLLFNGVAVFSFFLSVLSALDYPYRVLLVVKRKKSKDGYSGCMLQVFLSTVYRAFMLRRWI